MPNWNPTPTILPICDLISDRKSMHKVASLFCRTMSIKTMPVLFRFTLAGEPMVITKDKKCLVLSHADGTFLYAIKCLQKDAVNHFVSTLSARIKDAAQFRSLVFGMRNAIDEAKKEGRVNVP